MPSFHLLLLEHSESLKQQAVYLWLLSKNELEKEKPANVFVIFSEAKFYGMKLYDYEGLVMQMLSCYFCMRLKIP